MTVNAPTADPVVDAGEVGGAVANPIVDVGESDPFSGHDRASA